MRIVYVFRPGFPNGVHRWTLRSRRIYPEPPPDPTASILGKLAYEGNEAELVRCRAFAEKATANLRLDPDQPL